MRKPRAMRINPTDHEFSFLAVEQGDGECQSLFMRFGGNDEQEYFVTAAEARAIARFFTQYAEWAKKKEKACG
jgi:hypothetical protein